ncbi:helix-turn-helix transcriptional regulator [Paenibacillus sp. chi10]|uniref:Helix-turn-helix transcriptional regulator n=1 Tax=Paenibacillus suaedae TaxID=3077233 RepID=A0AAJ2N6M6_9BACL|nr:helix-turn-helix transcriptional regulator [Paenibacillus sp. chi10]MDT8980022.1 helix-turn-helix transcriptional regulator [Paenibacillus sp. chi10]
MIQLDLNFIKSRRMSKGLILQDVATRLGFKHASTYMKYEDGIYSFKANQLPILAELLDCQIENFFAQNFAETANDISSKEVS